MKRLGVLLTMLFALSFVAQAQNGDCAICTGVICAVANTGWCDCGPHCVFYQGKEDCYCVGYYACSSTGNGGIKPSIPICENFLGKPQQAGKTSCKQPLTAEVVRVFPWVKSEAFVKAIADESALPEAPTAILALQQSAAAKGLSSAMEAQTAHYIGDKKANPPHLSRLVGVIAKRQADTDGSYLFSFYLDLPGPGGETKYQSVAAMEKDKVEPVETVRVKGNHYVHTLQGGVVQEGEF
jgi:hypothetical protein